MSVNSEPHRKVRRQGPATLRGKQIPATTTDQRLLDRRGPAEWVHTDPWRVLRIQAEFVEAFGLLAELGQQAERLHELGLDPQHAPGVGVHPLGRAAPVEQPLVGGCRRYLLAAQRGGSLATDLPVRL